MGSRLSRLLLAIPFIAAGVMVYGWPISPDNDLFFHLKCGETILRTKRWLLHDIFTYTAAGTPDESWHSWLSQVIFYLIYRSFGIAGLKILNFVLVAVTLGVAARYLARKTRNVFVVVAGTILVLLLHHHVQVIRPLLFGEALFAAMAFGYLAEDRRLGRGELALCAVMALFWANLHGSAVIVLPLFLIHMVSQRQPAALVVPLATMLNPRGAGLYTYAWDLSRTAKSAGNWEWGSATPFLWIDRFALPPLLQIHLDPVSLSLLALGACLVWALFKDRNRLLPLNGFCFLLPLVSMRHALYLMLPASFFVTRWARHFKRPWQPVAAMGLALASLFLFRVHESGYVITSIDRACDFLDETGMEGNIFSDSGWGGYLIYRHYPRLRVAFDSRSIVHRKFFEKATELYGRYGKAAWQDIVEGLPEETDFIMALSWKRQALDFLDPKQWIVIFENNHSTIVMRRSERNRRNIARVHAYYQKREVPFDLNRGFETRQAWEKSRAWFESYQERMHWGRWPQTATVNRWKDKERIFYDSRNIPPVG